MDVRNKQILLILGFTKLRITSPKGLLTDKSDAIGSCNLKPNDNDNENDDNLSSN